jgi:argininosuccinate lyase
MMPQKRNPDALEIARGCAARTLGDFTSLVVALKGLPSGYNKDLQDDKRALFDAIDLMHLVLPAVTGALDEITFNTDRMNAACSSAMMATDLADYLVNKGIPFREAHGVVGSLVRLSETSSTELDAFPFETFAKAHSAFANDVYEWLSANGSVGRRNVAGGTGPDAVREQIAAAHRTLE